MRAGKIFLTAALAILPIVGEHHVPAGTSEAGAGDIVQSVFISPKEPTSRGLIWGAGPTFVGLKQNGPWTFSMRMNHIWSYAGTEARKEVNATFIQPFMSYITTAKTTFTLQTETTYDWEGHDWNIPINILVSQLFKVGD